MKLTIEEEAKRMCDKARRKNPALSFFLVDPACSYCWRKVRAKRAEAKKKAEEES